MDPPLRFGNGASTRFAVELSLHDFLTIHVDVPWCGEPYPHVVPFDGDDGDRHLARRHYNLFTQFAAED
jgi:hypothetical protein